MADHRKTKDIRRGLPIRRQPFKIGEWHPLDEHPPTGDVEQTGPAANARAEPRALREELLELRFVQLRQEVADALEKAESLRPRHRTSSFVSASTDATDILAPAPP